MQYEYRNRYGDIYVFRKNEIGNIEWRGDFTYVRFGFHNDPKDLLMVDPSGGPFISIGTDLKIFGFGPSKVVGIIDRDYGYELVIDRVF